jgi:hypothetical protein
MPAVLATDTAAKLEPASPNDAHASVSVSLLIIDFVVYNGSERSACISDSDQTFQIYPTLPESGQA